MIFLVFLTYLGNQNIPLCQVVKWIWDKKKGQRNWDPVAECVSGGEKEDSICERLLLAHWMVILVWPSVGWLIILVHLRISQLICCPVVKEIITPTLTSARRHHHQVDITVVDGGRPVSAWSPELIRNMLPTFMSLRISSDNTNHPVTFCLVVSSYRNGKSTKLVQLQC